MDFLIRNLLVFDFNLIDIFNFSSLIYYVLAIVFFIAAKWTYDFFTIRKLNDHLLKEDNKAIAIAFSGYLLATVIIIASVLSEPPSTHTVRHADTLNNSDKTTSYPCPLLDGSYDPRCLDDSKMQPQKEIFNIADFLRDAAQSIVWIVLGMILLLLSGKINDKFILSFISNRLEMSRDHNAGVGACMFASYLGAALIIRSLIIGPNMTKSIFTDIALLIIYYLATQLAFVVFFKLYRVTSKYDIEKEIEKDNVAAGISLGCHYIAISLMLAHILTVSSSLILFFLYFVNSSVFLLLTRWIFDVILFHRSSIAKEITEDENWGIAFVQGMVVIGVALILNTVFSPLA